MFRLWLWIQSAFVVSPCDCWEPPHYPMTRIACLTPCVYIPQSVHSTPVRTLIIFCAEQPVCQIIEILWKTPFVLDLWLLPAPFDLFAFWFMVYDFCFVYFVYNSCLLPDTSALQNFDFDSCLFLDRSSARCICLSKPWLPGYRTPVKNYVFCTVPGLHLVPCPNITNGPGACVNSLAFLAFANHYLFFKT